MSGSELTRRIEEREVAVARYGTELTRLDAALPTLPSALPASALALPSRPLADRAGAPLPAPPAAEGWRGRLSRFVWSLVAPVFAEQQQLNLQMAAQMDDLAAAVRQAAHDAAERDRTLLGLLGAFNGFNSILVQCLQVVPPFIDTKDRVLDTQLQETTMVAAAAQRTAVAARRELERAGAPTGAVVPEVGAAPVAAAATAQASGFNVDYVGFEDLFRGSEEAIRARQVEYADVLQGAGDVLDIGCGRGEFLRLLGERGMRARGVDTNAEMVHACREAGLEASVGDGLGYLSTIEAGSLDAITAMQVVEHLPPEYLTALIRAAFEALRPGGTLILETINVTCWVAFFESYMRDITHVRPLHPETLRFLVVAAGFTHVDIHYKSPVAPEGRLQPLDLATLPPALHDAGRTINLNVERLNDRIFTHLDYAIVGRKDGGVGR